MNKPVTPHRWFAGWRASTRAAENDPADFGTAFGLDLSLNEIAHEPEPAARRPPGWIQRLAQRRTKPAA